MVTRGGYAEKLSAFDHLTDAGVKVEEVVDLLLKNLKDEHSMEALNEAMARREGGPRLTEGVGSSPYNRIMMENDWLNTTGWLLVPLGRYLGLLDRKSKQYKEVSSMLFNYAENCRVGETVSRSLEALLLHYHDHVALENEEFQEEKKEFRTQLVNVIQKKAQTVLEVPEQDRCQAENSENGAGVWFAVYALAGMGGTEASTEAEQTLVSIWQSAEKHADDFLGLNTGALIGLGYHGISSLPTAVLLAFRSLLDRATARDEHNTGLRGWSNGECMSLWHVVRAAKGVIRVVQSTWPESQREAQVEGLSKSLGHFLDRLAVCRDHPLWTSVTLNTIEALQLCRKKQSRQYLVPLLIHSNPIVVEAAVRALLKIVGIEDTMSDIMNTAARAQTAGQVEVLSNAVRMLAQTSENKETVLRELESSMGAGMPVERQEAARGLLVEMGGASAMRKLQARSDSVDAYRAVLKDAESRMQTLFERTMADAKRGFNVALGMDVAVFTVGVLLVVASGAQALSTGSQGLASWVGVGISGGMGVLATLYTLLISKPRAQVRAAVDHQMFIKVVFLGYLRELQQKDQSFTRRMMEDNPLSDEEVSAYSEGVQRTMGSALNH
eukprot:CAMPEP_0182890658 /NCGR_PEP_ID=MMETSP0034_2-20130328/22790_1 /TAXON_ID=156128 /ORGANISM="Nephroselmis pyriformis, Strain CCMP717" /LENGTH=609 /DNA_ID=CAMNT_0025024223 /DNA_START=58 /DNA_END=1884 /DNA_ORIENTATION=+